MLVTEAPIHEVVTVVRRAAEVVLVFRAGLLPGWVLQNLGELLRHASLPPEAPVEQDG